VLGVVQGTPYAPHVSDDDVVVLAIEDSIDLHGFQPRDIPDVVASYIEAAFEKGIGDPG
jgi:hypothetical protein